MGKLREKYQFSSLWKKIPIRKRLELFLLPERSWDLLPVTRVVAILGKCFQRKQIVCYRFPLNTGMAALCFEGVSDLCSLLSKDVPDQVAVV